ncbi:AMP-binding protein [Leucothrix mucor]|uniref:AMP-binding protein n=1 Tax=Leucothrix mucor TaxID=45248 RepID=UPI0003B60CF3|nr:AMP-binding protein [Leucothrix mucor]
MSTPLDHSRHATSIGQFLEEAAQRYSNLNAFSCGPMKLGYSELAQHGKAFAAYLQSVGVAKGDRVAIMTPNLPAFPIATLGILKSGAAQVNINPQYTASELEHQLNDSGAETLVVFSGSTASYAAIKDNCPVKRVIVVNMSDGTSSDLPSPELDPAITDFVRFSDALATGAELEFQPVEIAREDLAFLQYTGGTTGPSKGAMLSHHNILSNIAQSYERIADVTCETEEVVVTAIPMYHIFALSVNFLTFAGCGSHNILITNPRDMAGFMADIKDSGFTVITGVNTLYAGMTSHPDFVNVDFSKLKASINGGTAALEATSDKWQSITGRPLIQGYGLSETSPILTWTLASVRTFTGKIGQAYPDTDIKLLDDANNEVAVGERGELVAKGPQVTSGYYKQPEATAEAFTADGYFRTGDIAIADETGTFKIVDRKKDMVIVSGFNVYPNEVEQAAAKCEGVRECACLGVPDEKTGEAVKLFVVREAGSKVTQEDIIAHCRDHLTSYKVPKIVTFIDEVPKSAVGKMLRRVLRDA